MHSIAFGPIVDGVIIPEQSLKDVMATNFENFDVMVGIAQSESLHMFPADIGKHSLKWPIRKKVPVREKRRNFYIINMYWVPDIWSTVLSN